MATGGRRETGIRLRPLAIGDVLDETFRVYRRQFLAFVTAMALVVVPVAVLGLLTGVLGASDGMVSAAQVVALLVTVVPLIVINSVARVVAGAACVQIAADTILGRPVDVATAYRHALGRLGPLLSSSLLIFLAVGLLFLSCLGIPFAVYLGLGWALAYPAIVLEGLGGIDGMRRSRDLVQGHRWRLLTCTVLVGLIVFLLVSVPSGLFSFVVGIVLAVTDVGAAGMVASQVGSTLFQALGETLFGAIGSITLTLLYYDLRVRKEAFDLQQRAALDEPTAGTWAPGASTPVGPAPGQGFPAHPVPPGSSAIPPPPLHPPDR